MFHHRQTLIEQLKSESDPAMTLHLSVVVLFQTMTQVMLHAPGRLVPSIITFLANHLEAEKVEVLTQMQGEFKILRFKFDVNNELRLSSGQVMVCEQVESYE